jgi:hypothetical protein
VGRATSVVLSALGLLFSYLGARRYAGEAAGGIAVLLGATFVFGIYFQTITKTYALTTFLFSATFFLLSSQEGGRRKWVGGTVVVLLAAFTRLSAVLFALPLVVYAFLKADRRGKIMIAAVIFGAIVMAALLVMPKVEAAMWNLIIHHAAQWGDLSLSERVVVVVRDRSEALYRVFPSYIGLVGAMVVFGLKPMVRYVWGRPILLATILGLLLFSLPNLMSGAFHAEYFTPFVFGFMPILAVVFVEIKQRVGVFSRIGLYLVLIGALGLALFRGGWAFVDRTGGRLPVEEIREVADFVVENSTPEDQVFAMEGLWVVVEAERDTPPNMTMAQFSFYRGPVEEAADFKLINEFVTLDYFRAGIPKLVILTDFDWRILMNSEDFELVQAALTAGYE